MRSNNKSVTDLPVRIREDAQYSMSLSGLLVHTQRRINSKLMNTATRIICLGSGSIVRKFSFLQSRYLVLLLVLSCLGTSASVHSFPSADIIGGSPTANFTPDTFADDSVRIIGGAPASSVYPWMVSIQTSGHFCGGVLIGKDWVLTAAHCLESVSADDLTLIIGTNNIGPLTEGEVKQAQWFALHPEYINDRFYHDYAIIKLDSSSAQTPIKIISEVSNASIPQGESLRVIGWGLTEEDNNASAPSQLMQVDVDFQSDEVCQGIYGNLGIGDYWQYALCAGVDEGGKDACQGDSGGPILAQGNGEWLLMGLVSWGDGCGREGRFGVYSEVSAIQDWIEQRRRGLTIAGPDKIGFVGVGRSKAQEFTVVNYSTSTQTPEASMLTTDFDLDANNWLLDAGIPSNYECSFTINANSSTSGEKNGRFDLALPEYTASQELNAKVLEAISFDGLTLFSGTDVFSITEHSEPWVQVSDPEGSGNQVLTPTNHSQDSRSVLLTYLDGSGTSDTNYLRFDARVDSYCGSLQCEDVLGVSINETFYNLTSSGEVSLTFADASDGWQTYAAPLPEDINHVLFILFKGSNVNTGDPGESNGRAYLDNLEVCTDPNVNATCSDASGFYNSQDLALVDDPNPSDDWTSVCTSVTYSDSAISYANRSGVSVQGRRSGGGTLAWLLLMLIPLGFRIRR